MALQHPRGFGEIGRERLLDQHRNAALDGGHDRIDMKMFVGRDDDGVHFGTPQQFAIIGGDEIGADLVGDQLGACRVLLGDADPVDGRVARRDFAAEQADTAGADDREADALSLLSQVLAST